MPTRPACGLAPPEPQRLAGLLRAAGATAQLDGDQVLIAGMAQEQVARMALDARCLLVELVGLQPDLERRFFDLTAAA